MIYYFSATGNSRHVATRIAEALGTQAQSSDSGTFHWDVSNPKLLLNVGDAIEGMSELSVETLNTLTK